MADVTPEKVTNRGSMGSDETLHEHESYGMVQMSRVTGGHPNLFGSSIDNNEKIVLEISHAERSRHLNRYWYHSKATIVYVEMSQAQFAEAITSMNMGQGVPVTITRLGGKQVGPCPAINERQKFETEFKEDVDSALAMADDLVDQVHELMDKKTVLKADRVTIKDLVERLRRSLISSLPFVQKSFNEACDATVTEAKAEVEASVLHAVMVAGLDAIAKDGPQALQQAPQLQIEGEK